jgi:KaiC/GvpD/RAD55 family RecA-like ATPase
MTSEGVVQSSGFTTGVATLDRLLGGPLGGREVVLLRGGPGTGKTTLTLQILSNHLGGGGSGAFLSLEDDPTEAIERARRSFGFAFPEDTPRGSRSAVSTALYGVKHDEVQDRLKEYLGSLAGEGAGLHLVVIDSLNVLAAVLTERFNTWPLRLALHHICQGIQASLGGCVVLLTGESHGAHGELATAMAESFVCDTEIELSRQEVSRPHAAGERSRGRGDSAPLRETRCFCRVAKSRTTRHQFRRCAYEITAEGLTFFETYPGDGRFLVFFENAPQESQLTDLSDTDIPHLYPGLVVESFDRNGLQQTLASQRRLCSVPSQMDMSLATYDTYWVDWYVELNRRDRVAASVKQALGAEDPRLAGVVHAACLRTLEETAAHPKRSALAEAAGAIVAGLCDGSPPAVERRQLQQVLAENLEYFSTEEGRSGIFSVLALDSLRLFGDRRSKIIAELPQSRYAVATDGQQRVRAIPVNANVGLFVYRKDVIDDAINVGALDEEGLTAELERLWRLECELGGSDPREQPVPDIIGAVVGRFFACWREREEGPVTWEEVIAISRLCGKDLVIEAATFDSFMATFLELLWAVGGSLRVDASYRIADREETVESLILAAGLLGQMFADGTVPRDATLAPDAFARRYQPSEATPSRDWVFARHWHSTLIDVLTARKGAASPQVERPFLWVNEKARLGIMQVPTTIHRLLRDSRKGFTGDPPREGCWGEWYLALLKGSENEKLACELINWLMSSRKIIEAALAGALLPTVEAFYDLYGDARCIDVPGRPHESLPDTTFREARELFFRNARFRSETFDYPHCAREIHGILEWLRTRARGKADLLALRERIVEAALRRIESLNGLDLLRRDYETPGHTAAHSLVLG